MHNHRCISVVCTMREREQERGDGWRVFERKYIRLTSARQDASTLSSSPAIQRGLLGCLANSHSLCLWNLAALVDVMWMIHESQCIFHAETYTSSRDGPLGNMFTGFDPFFTLTTVKLRRNLAKMRRLSLCCSCARDSPVGLAKEPACGRVMHLRHQTIYGLFFPRLREIYRIDR